MPSYVTALLLTFPHTELEPNYYQMSREKVSAPRRGEICGELVTSLGLHSSLLTPQPLPIRPTLSQGFKQSRPAS